MTELGGCCGTRRRRLRPRERSTPARRWRRIGRGAWTGSRRSLPSSTGGRRTGNRSSTGCTRRTSGSGQGSARLILEPVVADLIRLYDQLAREVRRLDAAGQDRRLIRSFAEDVGQILDRCGIEVFSAEPGDPFERDRHRAAGRGACDDQSRAQHRGGGGRARAFTSARPGRSGARSRRVFTSTSRPAARPARTGRNRSEVTWLPTELTWVPPTPASPTSTQRPGGGPEERGGRGHHAFGGLFRVAGERGRRASQAKDSALLAPHLVAQLIKRQMGKSDVHYSFHGQGHTPESISALILRELARPRPSRRARRSATWSSPCPPTSGSPEREATRKAGQMAGLEVLDVLAEPVAAALHYQALGRRRRGPAHLVYDLGGGTFDTTVIRLTGDDVEVVCTDGDHQPGRRRLGRHDRRLPAGRLHRASTPSSTRAATSSSCRTWRPRSNSSRRR